MAKEKKEKVKKEDQVGKIDKVEIKSKTDKIIKRDIHIRVLKIGLLVVSIALIIMYFLLNMYYSSGAFTVVMDQEFARKSGLIMYENLKIKEVRNILEAPRPEIMDNISINWLPQNINDESDGSHNGDNHIAYTFYIENRGVVTHYWYTIVIDDVIKDVDEAVRIWLYHNGEPTLYAKMGKNGQPEKDTIPFFSNEYVMMEKRESIKPGEIDKFTVVIWVEGDDPDCLDNLIGGEMKMHMEITEERIPDKKNR